MKNEFNEKYKVTNYRYEEEKKKIIQNNKKKPVYAIKKIIKKKYPDITNEEMIQLIGELNKTRTFRNLKKTSKNEEER